MTRHATADLLRALATDIEAGRGEHFPQADGWIVRGDPSVLVRQTGGRIEITIIKQQRGGK